MAFGKINHLEFLVDDLEEAVKYFTEKLGFKLVRRFDVGWGFGKAVEVKAPNGTEIFELHQVTDEFKEQIKKAPGWAYFNHIAFEVEDLDKEYEELKSKGVYFETDGPTPTADTPHFQPATGRKLVTTFDAEGHKCIQLVEVKHE